MADLASGHYRIEVSRNVHIMAQFGFLVNESLSITTQSTLLRLSPSLRLDQRVGTKHYLRGQLTASTALTEKG
ncbi:MAG: hypothetical protein OSB34_16145, partial [Planktomarina sp.]|nr:hypothetical protein [Planktomarina sp.]